MTPFDRPVRMARALAFAAAALVLVTACSSSSTPTPTTTEAPTTALTTAPTSAAPSAATEAPTAAATETPAASTAGAAGDVQVATGSVGTYLTAVGGMTLYVFKNDSAGKSTCSGQCASNWPPFEVSPGNTVTAGTGVSGKLGTITRDDGTTQVTYNDAPLYYFAADKAAGDTTGQGIGNVWFVANP
jgi:predicted lipoprotein with Yx(FWY)xxD motif